MNTSLVLLCLVIAFAATEAYPGMRNNGASGDIAYLDPFNPANNAAFAKSKSTGDNAFSATFTQEKEGSKFAYARASNTGGGPVITAARA